MTFKRYLLNTPCISGSNSALRNFPARYLRNFRDKRNSNPRSTSTARGSEQRRPILTPPPPPPPAPVNFEILFRAPVPRRNFPGAKFHVAPAARGGDIFFFFSRSRRKRRFLNTKSNSGIGGNSRSHDRPIDNCRRRLTESANSCKNEEEEIASGDVVTLRAEEKKKGKGKKRKESRRSTTSG